MTVPTLIITPQGVADAVENMARKVSESYISYTGQVSSFETLMQDFLLCPIDQFSAFTHHRAYSLDNDLIRLQTALTVLIDTADAVAEQELGLDERAGLVLRWEIDRAIGQSRRLIDQLRFESGTYGIDPAAPIFRVWPQSGRELVREHPLFDPENEEFF
jgi:hypothetical protein